MLSKNANHLEIFLSPKGNGETYTSSAEAQKDEWELTRIGDATHLKWSATIYDKGSEFGNRGSTNYFLYQMSSSMFNFNQLFRSCIKI